MQTTKENLRSGRWRKLEYKPGKELKMLSKGLKN
jgi:hypothetical protein